MTEQHRHAFLEEVGELLAELESSFLELEERPDDPELIGRVFRALHTIKGAGAMFGFDGAASFTHQVESVFDKVRNGELPVTRPLITLSLAALDQIRKMLAAGDGERGADGGECAAIVADFRVLLSPADSGRPDSSPAAVAVDFLGLLTEYEISRVKANLRQKKGLYTVRVAFPLATIDAALAESSGRIRAEGELISAVPDAGREEPDTIGFRLFFASDRDPARLEERLGAKPERVALPEQLAAGTAGEEGPPRSGAPEVTYRVRFRPGTESLLAGLDPFALFAELRRLGTCRVMAQTGAIPPLPEIDPTACHTSWDIILTTCRGEGAIRDVFFFVGSDEELRIELIDADGGGKGDGKRLGEILVERGDLSREELEKVLARQKRIGELLVENGIVEAGAVEAALAEQQTVKELSRERQSRESAGSIRVPTEKLDLLVNLVGELVTVQARLGQAVASPSGNDLPAIAEEVERLAGELRDNALSIRMLPIGTIFGTFQRLLRDLSLELGKEAELVTVGAETELDKTVIERLGDPLVHLIRNSIDHGIESPETRLKAGKPSKGTVRLAAVHSGDSVLITIDDDGAGLDREAIRAKGVERGLIAPAAEPADREIFALIFAPGFSTARKVSSVSGRGVGMDVVKRAIDALRGSIDLRSRQGAGTTIAIKIPLTLAIIESLLVRIGGERFILPLSLVDECVELSRADAAKGRWHSLINVRGQIVPYVSLREQFGIGGASPAIEQVVITRVDGMRVGFVVDQVIGGHQTVIKSLGRPYRHVEALSGAAILGDGSVALILDIPRMVRAVERKKEG